MIGHLCQYGLRVPAKGGSTAPAMKPTRFLSSAPEVLARLGKRCDRSHKHQVLHGGPRVTAAGVYPPELCRAMLEGIEAQRRREGVGVPGFVSKELERGCALYSLDRAEVKLDPGWWGTQTT